MKTIKLLIACLSFATATYAGNVHGITPNQLRLENKIQGVNIQATNQMENLFSASKKNVKAKDAEMDQSQKPAFFYKQMLNEKELREMAAYTLKEKCDSMVGTWYMSGDRYGKMTFEFYEDTHYPKRHVVNYWNPSIQQWMPEEEHYYEWDEDGYCTLQQIIFVQAEFGERREYTYNNQKLGDSQTISRYDSTISNDWVFSEKGVYEYNDQEDIIDETASVWDGTAWVPFVRNKAAWDKNHRQTNFEPYIWNGAEWIGNGEKSVHEYDSNGNTTVEGRYLWDNGWFNYFKLEQNFLNNDAEHLQRSAWQYWNKTNSDWSGCELYHGTEMHNQLYEFEYDQLGRKTYDGFSIAFTPGNYTLAACRNLTWTDIEDGLVQSEDTSTVYASYEEVFDEPFVNDVRISRYDATGNKVYFFERFIDMGSGTLVDYATEENKYENGDLVREYKYDFEPNEALCVTYAYDNDHNMIERIGRMKYEQGNNEENWNNISRYEYTYDQQHDLCTKQLAYAWNGIEWVPSWGGEDIYDFDANLSEIQMWIGGDFRYKILETRSYTNNDGDWDYLSCKYYYSDITSGVEEQLANTNITVYPKCVENQLNINSDKDVNVNIYNLQGACVISTNEKAINVSNLVNGIYLVEVNGYKTKIIKK